jgi:transcriptional regulator with PAS, ATPase and Fis domain
MDLIALKQRYGIIGHCPALDRAINIAVQVAATDLSVLILGESGVGKENFSKIIHDNSTYKHGAYITVNCGAIPEGTIDSELFGHEKGAFTGATETRKGYFEVADGGTIFLDEVADLPMGTQVRLLRVLETGDFMKVGSSKTQKTKVRVIAATNVNIGERIAKGKFREDLYYRLNTVPILIPPLRDRGEDILLLFIKFASDFAAKYRFPQLELAPDAIEMLEKYQWPGNIRQLKNLTEQMSLIEKTRLISVQTLSKYIESHSISSLPALLKTDNKEQNASYNFERDLIFNFLGDMKKEISELKEVVAHIAVKQDYEYDPEPSIPIEGGSLHTAFKGKSPYQYVPKEHVEVELPAEEVVYEDTYSISDSEKELIKKALVKHGYRRKPAADELGISERTLYRKIKEYNLWK